VFERETPSRLGTAGTPEVGIEEGLRLGLQWSSTCGDPLFALLAKKLTANNACSGPPAVSDGGRSAADVFIWVRWKGGAVLAPWVPAGSISTASTNDLGRRTVGLRHRRRGHRPHEWRTARGARGPARHRRRAAPGPAGTVSSRR
jgi:hypothetical protein